MLKVNDLYVGYYKDINILQGVHLSADLNRITCVIGPNGVGKSTLLKTIYGFLTPNKGEISFAGKIIVGMRPHEMVNLGLFYIPQHPSIFPYMTVEENLLLGAWGFRRDRRKVRERLDQNFQRFPVLRDRRKSKAGELSGGQQRMVELARALMTSPRFLLVDEPTAGLAPKAAQDIYVCLVQLKEGERLGILLVDQNIREAIKISDYVYVFDLGQNKAEGSRDQFTDVYEIIRDWIS